MTQEMSVWPACWELDALLSEEPPNFSAVATRLTGNWTLQHFLFRHRGYGDARLLAALVKARFFASVPPLEGHARYWPALDYLQRVGADDPKRVSQILATLSTDNYAVLEQAIAVLVTLNLTPARLAAAVRRLANQWLATSPNFLDAQLWSGLLRKIGSQPFAAEFAPRLLAISATFSNAYEFKLLLDEISVALPPVAALDAVEDSLLAVLAAQPEHQLRWRVRDLASNDDYPDDQWAHLVRAWLRLSERGSGDTLRAGRLVGSSNSTARQLGVRALGRALDFGAMPELEVELLAKLVQAIDPREDYDVRDELEVLLLRHFERLPLDLRSEYVTKFAALAVSDDKLDRYIARNALAAARESLGPVEQWILQRLVSELGEPSIGGVRSVVSSWIGPESPISTSQMHGLSTQELLALMRFSPGPDPREHWGPSIEGLANQLREEVSQRPSEFLALADENWESIDNPSVQSALVDGLGRAVKEGILPGSVELLSYFDRLLGKFDGEEPADAGVRKSVGWALMDATEHFVAVAPRELVRLVVRLATDPSPTTNNDAGWGDDRLSQGLNVARGVGLRLAVSVLLIHREDLEGSLWSAVEAAVLERCRSERHPAVLTAFGLYLRYIDRQLPTLWDAVQKRLTLDDPEAFGAVFGAFVSMNPSSPTDERLAEKYADAVTIRQQEASTYLTRTWGNVLSHLVALHLFSREAALWPALVDAAMAVASSEERKRSVSAAGAVIRRGEDGVPLDAERLVGFVAQRIAAIRAGASDEQESGALAELLIDANVPLEAGGGLLLDAMRLRGRPRGGDLLRYLEEQAPRLPTLAGFALQSYLSSGAEYWAWSTEGDALRSVLRSLTANAEAARIGLSTVEWLAHHGAFACEPEARQIYAAVGEG